MWQMDQREGLLQAVVSNSPLALFAFGTDGVITMSEGQALRGPGRRSNEMVGGNIDELYRDFPHVLEYCRRALAGETVTACIEHSGRFFDTRFIPVFDGGDEITGVFGVATDVTERVQSGRELTVSTQRFQNAFEYAAIGKGIVSPDGRWMQVNKALCTMLGYTEEELLSLSFQQLTYRDDLNADVGVHRRMLNGEITSYQVEKRYLHKDGHVVWIHLNTTMVRDLDDKPLCSISEIEDITARKLAEEDIVRRQAQLQEIIAMQRSIGVADLDLDEVMKTIIDQTRQITGAEVAGIGLVDGDQLVYRAMSDPAAVGIRVKLDASLSGLSVRTGEILVTGDVDLDPRVDPVSVRVVGVKSIITIPLKHAGSTIGALAVSSPRYNLFTQRDVETLELLLGQLSAAISHARQREAEIALNRERAAELEISRHRATHDPLTELPNRTLLFDRLTNAIQITHRRRTHCVLLYLDLNGFKKTNDTFGHRAGDLLLREVSARLQETLRESDTVARLGGDEFAVLLPDTDRQGGLQTAHKVMEQLRRPAVVDDHHLPVGGSIGVAVYPDDGDTLEALIQAADAAMYHAKRAGTGIAQHSSTMA